MSTYANVELRLTIENKILMGSEEGQIGPEPLRLDLNEITLAMELIKAERTNPELILRLGQQLYQALFPTPVRTLFERNRTVAERVRLRLRFDSAEMAALPWEYLHDGNVFLAKDQDLSIVRFPEVRERLQPLTVDGPLRVLVVLASPENLPAFDQFALIDALKTTFSPLQIDGRLEVDIIPDVTYANLMRHMRSRPYHILHFIGYTALDPMTRQPAIIINEENQTARRLPADNLGSLLYQEDQGRMRGEQRALRLVLISDIELTETSASNYSVAVAKTLLHMDTPAAIAMQNSLPVAVTGLFAAEFYAAIAHGEPLDQAIIRGRWAIQNQNESRLDQEVVAGEWASPVLFLHATDGRLFAPRQVKQLEFNTSSNSIFTQIEEFSVKTNDPVTRFLLDHLNAFMVAGVLLLFAYWKRADQVDFLLVSGIAVVFAATWLLRDLFRHKLPATLNALWRQRVILPHRDRNLAQDYINFLDDYNRLLNHPRFVWLSRGFVLVIALFAAIYFKPVTAWTRTEEAIFRPAIFIFYALIGYVLGTLLWKMIATVISSTRLSHSFDLDIQPTHPDRCGGLKALGDLYFNHAWIVLLAGFFLAAWLILLAVSDVVVQSYSANHFSEQSLDVEKYDKNCYNKEAPKLGGAVCKCIQSECDTPYLCPPLPQILNFCLNDNAAGAVQDGEQPGLISTAYNIFQFYRWFDVYSILLAVVGIIAVIVFVLPMLHTYRLMRAEASYYKQQAHSLAGEMIELERQLQQQTTVSIERDVEVSQRLHWLQLRYQKYVNSPCWPFDSQVRLRLVGSLLIFAISFLIATQLSEIIGRLLP